MHVSSLFQPRQQRECVVCRVTPPRLARQPNEEYLEQAGVLGSWAGPLSGAVAARCRMLPRSISYRRHRYTQPRAQQGYVICVYFFS